MQVNHVCVLDQGVGRGRILPVLSGAGGRTVPLRLLLLPAEPGAEASRVQHDSLQLRVSHVPAGRSAQVGTHRLQLLPGWSLTLHTPLLFSFANLQNRFWAFQGF